MPWAQAEHDSVSLLYQPLISAKGSFDPDLMLIRNALKKADSKSSEKITGALHGVWLWFAVQLWGWRVFEQLYIEEGMKCCLDYPPVKCNVW